jgi:hypothetical protein
MALNHEGYLSQRLVLLYMAKNQGASFIQKCCTMVRSVSSQERGQITVTLFLLLRPFFHLLLLNVFLFFLGTKTAFLSYSFYYDFHLNSSFYRKTNIESYLPFL